MWLLTLQRKFTPDTEIQNFIYDSWHSHTQIFKFQICYLNHIWLKTYVGEWISREKVDLYANFRKNRTISKFLALFLTINRYYQMGTNLTVFWLCKVNSSKFRNMRISSKCNFWLCTAIPNRLSEVNSGDMWFLTLQMKIYTRYVNRKIHVRFLTVTGNAYTNF